MSSRIGFWIRQIAWRASSVSYARRAGWMVYSAVCCWMVCWLGASGGVQAAESGAIDFNRDIRPLLSDKCFLCHGPDEQTREADLRLDTQSGALTVIQPRDSDASELIRRLVTEDESERMPPPDSNRALSKEQITLLQRWVDEGAGWGQHWSFAPLAAPDVPKMDDSGSTTSSDPAAPIRNPIDAFVRARLVREGRQAAPEAARETLIRRVSLDLTGLPPTVAEVDAFLADTEPRAYERLVDRLLKSPAFGERMAWDWLDAARYADSNGYQGDGERTMWPWRDWVVDAFNRNLPYDQFTVWQLAGDLLPDATFEQRLATGFCRNHMINGEGGRIAEENRVDYVMDMTETTGTVWLGLTLNCCRCHDHKFDPLTRRDYYQLFAFFNQTPINGGGGNPQTPPILAAPTPDQSHRTAALEEQMKSLAERLAERGRALADSQPDWEAATLKAAGANAGWTLLEPTEVSAKHQTLTLQDDLSVLASGENPANDSYTFTASTDLQQITGLRLEALRHESMTNNGLARSDSGNFVLTEIEVLVQRADEAESRSAKIAAAEATFEQGDLKVAKAFDGDRRSGWAVYEGRPIDRDHQAVFRFDSPIPAGAATTLTIRLHHDSPHISHNLGRFRLSITSQPEPKLNDNRQALSAALAVPVDKRTKEQRAAVIAAHRASDTIYRDLEKQRGDTEKQLNGVRNAIAKVMVMQEADTRRTTFMLDRGLYNKPTDVEVTANTPAALPPLARDASDTAGATDTADSANETREQTAATNANRLDLARWLVADENPLTARVAANRFWQQFFGVGLVKTAEDFGSQGEIPPQLDLLNWLAAEFRDSGWDVKALARMIVTSHTYRQSSRTVADDGQPSEIVELDPENRLLARGPRFRMPSWMLRDQALAASGLLVRTQGGPPVNGYQPAGVWEEATFGRKTYRQDSGEALYRRSLYTFWRRIIAPTMFFDNASRQTCTVKPFRTNTPLHALLTLNDVTYVEAARAMAERVLLDVDGDDGATESSDAARLNLAFRRLLARMPSSEEQTILLAGLDRSRAAFAADPAAAAELLAVGESKRNAQLEPTEHASWTAMCLALLNLDEAVTKE